MQTLTSKELSDLWLKHQHDRQDNRGKFALVKTGLAALDKVLGGGIELGQLVYVGGPQKSGKTTLMVKFLTSFASQGIPTIWFGAEMNNMQIGNVVFAGMAGVQRTKIREIGLEEEDWKALNKAAVAVQNMPVFWNYGFSTVEDIWQVLLEVEKQHKTTIRAIFVDYLQLMETEDSKGGRSAEVEQLSRRLKRLTLARKEPLSVIAATQLNRVSIRGGLFDANAFLNSGGIERDSDIAMIIHDAMHDLTKQPMPGVKRIDVVASRETEVGHAFVRYNGSVAEICDVDDIPEVNLQDRNAWERNYGR